VANAAAQAGQLASLTSNAAVQAGSIADIYSNLAVKSGEIADLQANAASQAGQLAILTSNAAVQAGELATLTANAGAQSGDLSTLTSNAAVQAGELATLTSNAAIQAGELDTLISNAASQSGAIGAVAANISLLQDDVTNLTANVGAQSELIANISNGTATFSNLIPSANVTYSLGSETAQWKDLYLSGSTIYIGGGNIAVTGNIITTSLPFTATGTLSSDDLVVTNSVACGTIFAGQSELTGITTLYETGYDGNISTNTNGTVALTVTSAGGPWGAQGALLFEGNSPEGNGIIPSNNNQYSLGKLGYAWSSVYSQTFEVGSRINLPLGGGVTDIVTTAGNVSALIGPIAGAAAIVVSSANINITNSVDVTSANATVTIHNANTAVTHTWQFAEDGNLTGNIFFTMANTDHWTSNVSTISDALNQLAERIYNIENPT
jgi:hypothetical protein